jgi:hypothetical protein
MTSELPQTASSIVDGVIPDPPPTPPPNHKEMTVDTLFSVGDEQFRILIKGSIVEDLGIAAKNATLPEPKPEKGWRNAIFTYEELAERLGFPSVGDMMKKVENVQIPKKTE